MSSDGDPAESEAGAFTGPDWQQRSPDERGRIRVRRRKPARSKPRRYALIGAGLFVLLIVAAGAWLLYDGLAARSDLNAVRADVGKLHGEISAGRIEDARATAIDLRRHADAAESHASSAIWSLGLHLPGVGGPLRDARRLATVVDSIADDALPQLVDAAGALNPSTLRSPGGAIDLGAIQRVAPGLAHAHGALSKASAQIAAMPASSWSSIDSARHELAAELPGLTKQVGNATLAARVVPPLLGADGPKNYLITFENDAEMRATGGMPGAFAVLSADHGKLSFTRFEPDNYLVGVPAPNIDFGRQYRMLYSEPGRFAYNRDYRNTNLSPHFPYAAQLWAAMFERKTGVHIDGAFGVDPTALQYLLAVTGPATLPDGSSVGADNVVSLTQSTVYAKFVGQNAARKQYLLDIAKAVSHKLLAPGADTAGLLKAAVHAADESRLVFWTSDQPVEAQLQDLPLAGVEPVTDAPYFRFTMWNSTGSKLDYYIHAAVDWSSTGCGAKRDVSVTVTLHNTATPDLPRYVLGYTANPRFGPPAEEYLSVFAYVTHGAHLVSYARNGKNADYLIYDERGHPVIQDYDGVSVPPGGTVTLTYHLTEPASSAAPIVPAQPMVNPMKITVHSAHC